MFLCEPWSVPLWERNEPMNGVAHLWALRVNSLITLSLCTNLFLAELGPYFCMWSFSGCGQWGVVENRLQAHRQLCHCGGQSSHCADFSCKAWTPGSVWHGLACSEACRIFLDRGSNLCPLHWRVDSYHCTTREVPKVSLKINWKPSTLFLLVLLSPKLG